tara:strand:+ start:288 stop:566 length:279 start_codon:yes stop_codon:yes gene_type:complete
MTHFAGEPKYNRADTLEERELRNAHALAKATGGTVEMIRNIAGYSQPFVVVGDRKLTPDQMGYSNAAAQQGHPMSLDRDDWDTAVAYLLDAH